MTTESPVLFHRETLLRASEESTILRQLVGKDPGEPTEVGGPVAIATLNRPKQLNALTLDMCELLGKQLQTWADDDTVKCVVLNASGEKGFCAGGDVAEVIRNVRAGGEGRFDYGDAFFTTEYALDLLIHTYPKPIIALSHGICMGGGVGLIAGASHRVFVENSKIAMPEIHIGLFPDVGGGYFLNQLPDGIGALMALTGLIVTEGDAMHAGLADFVIDSAQRDGFIEAIGALPWTDDPVSNHQLISDRIGAMESVEGDPPSELAVYGDDMRALAQCDNVIAYRDALNALAARHPYFVSAAKNLAQGSPTAAHVTFEYLRRAKGFAIDEVLAMDLILAKQFQRHHDFSEGVRALLIDKDKAPQWSPREWNAVDRALVERHFLSP